MIFLQKQVLRVGRITNISDLRRDKPDTLNVTPALLRSWQKMLRAYRQHRLLSPVYFDHPEPYELSEPTTIRHFRSRLRDYHSPVGFVADFRPAGDGKSGVITIAILNPRVARKAVAKKFDLSPRYDVSVIGGKPRLTLLTFDLIPAGEAADKTQTRFRVVKPKPKLKPKPKGARRMTTTRRMNLATATDPAKASEEVLQTLREIHRVMGEVGQVGGDPFASALRILYPSQAEQILQGDGEGKTNDDVRVVQSVAAMGLDRRTVGNDDPAHSYSGGDCDSQQAKAEVEELKSRHPAMFRN